MPGKKTYSQSGEDIIVLDLFKIPVSPDYIYIDVGANQPTQISNTYLFYRMGFRGIVVEPNREMSGLFKRVRPEDTFLEVGCSESNGIGSFRISESSSVSGFSDKIVSKPNSYRWVPIVTVDDIWRNVGESKCIFLLSIDTEGFDLKVLKGATEALQRTLCIVVETCENDIGEIKELLHKSGFDLVATTANNLVWANMKAIKEIKLNNSVDV